MRRAPWFIHMVRAGEGVGATPLLTDTNTKLVHKEAQAQLDKCLD
jgi:hypothetical protein